MTAFVVATIVLILLALAFVVPTLLRKHDLEVDRRDQLNIRIARERLAELKQELAAGNISQQDFDQSREDLETTLAMDLEGGETGSASVETVASSRPMAIFLAIAIPLLAVLLYAETGSFEAVDAQPENASNDTQQSQTQAPQMTMEEAIAKLRERLEAEPDNAEGWFMLARTYAALGEYAKAVPAYKKLLELVGENDADLLLRYADALAVSEGRSLSGAALPYIEKALTVAPDHPQGLWMMGMAMEEKGEYQQALENWYRVLPQLREPADRNEMQRMIDAVVPKVDADVVENIRRKYVVQKVVAMPAAEIEVAVSLDDRLKNKVSPDDTVFVFARAVNGPPMPLAAVKRSAGTLPFTVKLNDAMAMQPAMKLSTFEQVVVSAKVSRSGNAAPAAGDLFGEVSPVATIGGETVKVIIDRVR